MSSPPVLTCPTCGQETPATSAFCHRCGSSLATAPGAAGGIAPAPSPSPVWAPAVPTPVLSSPDYQLSHRGQVYGVGYGPTFYGVWDLRVGGAPVATFERTPIAWEATWRRYQELELGGRVPAWRRARAGWIVVHILIATVIWFAQIVVFSAILFASGREIDGAPDDAVTAVSLAAVITFLATLAGWMLFVYLRSGTAVRTAVLMGLTLPTLGILVAVGLANLPPVA